MRFNIFFEPISFNSSFQYLILKTIFDHEFDKFDYSKSMVKEVPKEFKRGFVIDHYRLERLIGQGGYGLIYIVSDLSHDQTDDDLENEENKEISENSNNIDKNINTQTTNLDDFESQNRISEREAEIPERNINSQKHNQEGRNSNKPKFLAMKIEKIRPKKKGLITEIKNMKNFQDSPYFPKYYGCGQNSIYRWILYEILGPSLVFIRFELRRQRYSKYTAIRAGIEMLKCLEECHHRGFIHRDVKPGNYLVRPGSKSPIVLIDFGLSKRYKDFQGEIIPQKTNVGFTGTVRYASERAFMGIDQGRGDDLISWFYTLVEMIKGDLPFPYTKDKQKVSKAKKKIKPKKLCKNLPKQFLQIWNYVSHLEYYDEPDYQQIYDLLNEAARNLHHRDQIYDWQKLHKRKLHKISGIDIRNDEDTGEVNVFYKQKNIKQGCTIA